MPIEVNGASLEFNEQGQGDLLLFVHGSSSDLRTWEVQQERFSKSYRTLAYSRRYHWPNKPISVGGEYNLVEHVADLAALIESQSADPVHLVGHSYGALICITLATLRPELVRSIVLAEPPVLGLFVTVPPKPLELIRLALRHPRLAAGIVKLGAFGLGPATAASRRDDNDAVLKLTGKAILGPDYFQGLTEERLLQVRDNLIKEELLSAGFLPRLDSEKIGRISIPILLVGGDRSPRVFARLLDALESLLPHASRCIVHDASHLMHEDNAGEYNQCVSTHLSSL